MLAACLAFAWPACVGRREGVSPELQSPWLDNVREARTIYSNDWRTMLAGISLPVVGLVGYGLMLWRLRRDEAALIPWVAVAGLALLAFSLLFWQSRAGPPAQVLAVPGAAAIGWVVIRRIQASGNMLIRVVGTVGTFAIISGLGPQYAAQLVPNPPTKGGKVVSQANGKCPTLAALRPIARLPKGYVLTFVDLNPRLITVTHHDAVAGPYHRNQAAILDVQKAFRGSAENARRTVERRGIDYVLICPGLSESTLYSSDAPTGFYMQLVRGKVPGWLEPVRLPKNSPYRMWRVRRSAES